MKLPSDLPIHAETLLAVVLGAVLATVSGVLATGWEARLKRRERERGAALFYGDLLSTVGVLVDFAVSARGRGDPYGPVTLRMLRQIRREFDLYDRNRELLYDLADAPLRVRIHALVVRMAMPVDGVLDASDRLMATGEDAALIAVRDAGFDFFVELRGEIPAVVAALTGPAGQSFDIYRPAARTAGAEEAT